MSISLQLDEIIAKIEKAMEENKGSCELPPEADKPEIKDDLRRLGFWIAKTSKNKLIYWK